jgi:hypothetical protein
VAIFGAIAGAIFAWLSPEEARFGVLPETAADGRAAVEAAFLSAYAIAKVFAAVWALLAAALAYFLLPEDRPRLLQTVR